MDSWKEKERSDFKVVTSVVLSGSRTHGDWKEKLSFLTESLEMCFQQTTVRVYRKVGDYEYIQRRT